MGWLAQADAAVAAELAAARRAKDAARETELTELRGRIAGRAADLGRQLAALPPLTPTGQERGAWLRFYDWLDRYQVPAQRLLNQFGGEWARARQAYQRGEISASQMRGLVELRRRVVDSLAAEIVADLGGGVQAFGSTDLTSDYDLSFVGPNAPIAVILFNARFQGRWAMAADLGGREAAGALDTNVYTDPVFGQVRGGPDDVWHQDAFAHLAARKYLDDSGWREYREGVLAQAPAGQRAALREQLDWAEARHRNLEEAVARTPRSVLAAGELAGQPATEIDVAARNRLYEEGLQEVLRLTEAYERAAPGDRPAIAQALRNAQSRALYLAQEAYQTEAAITHVVVNIQAAGRDITVETLLGEGPVALRVPMTADQARQSFLEQMANVHKELAHGGDPLTLAGKVAKYFVRGLDGARIGGVNLREFREVVEKTVRANAERRDAGRLAAALGGDDGATAYLHEVLAAGVDLAGRLAGVSPTTVAERAPPAESARLRPAEADFVPAPGAAGPPSLPQLRAAARLDWQANGTIAAARRVEMLDRIADARLDLSLGQRALADRAWEMFDALRELDPDVRRLIPLGALLDFNRRAGIDGMTPEQLVAETVLSNGIRLAPERLAEAAGVPEAVALAALLDAEGQLYRLSRGGVAAAPPRRQGDPSAETRDAPAAAAPGPAGGAPDFSDSAMDRLLARVEAHEARLEQELAEEVRQDGLRAIQYDPVLRPLLEIARHAGDEAAIRTLALVGNLRAQMTPAEMVQADLALETILRLRALDPDLARLSAPDLARYVNLHAARGGPEGSAAAALAAEALLAQAPGVRLSPEALGRAAGLSGVEARQILEAARATLARQAGGGVEPGTGQPRRLGPSLPGFDPFEFLDRAPERPGPRGGEGFDPIGDLASLRLPGASAEPAPPPRRGGTPSAIGRSASCSTSTTATSPSWSPPSTGARSPTATWSRCGAFSSRCVIFCRTRSPPPGSGSSARATRRRPSRSSGGTAIPASVAASRIASSGSSTGRRPAGTRRPARSSPTGKPATSCSTTTRPCPTSAARSRTPT